jgi:hypothetical protein
MTRTLCIVAVTLLTGCSNMKTDMPVLGLVDRVERAHGADRWYSHDAVAAHIDVGFGGGKVVSGTFTFDPAVGKVRAELDNGTTIVFDGKTCWVAPADSDFPGARFHVLTWPYFAATAFKLDDPGAQVRPLDEPLEYNGKPHLGAKLTFSPGTGDAPDDWYILYVDPDNHWLRAMAYIVTYGKDGNKLAEAKAEPHAIVYDDYVRIGGALVSRRWTFYHWSQEAGIHGDPMGHVSLSNIRFVTPDEDTFIAPPGAREESLPGS